jgi:hypothetical protein
MGERRRLVRPLANSKGWSIVNEHANGDDLTYEQGVSVKVDAGGRLTIEPVDSAEAGLISTTYANHLDHLATTDISGLLCRMVGKSSAVSLRDTGGFYFVPRANLDGWRKVVSVIRSVSAHKVYEMPALASDEAVGAILDAIETEASADVAALEEALDNPKLGVRALEGRIDKCGRVEKKVAQYEALLGRSLEHLTEKLASIQARLTEAALAKQAEADKEAQ